MGVMDVVLLGYEKDNCVKFKIGRREEQANLYEYDITEGSKQSLESVFFQLHLLFTISNHFQNDF